MEHLLKLPLALLLALAGLAFITLGIKGSLPKSLIDFEATNNGERVLFAIAGGLLCALAYLLERRAKVPPTPQKTKSIEKAPANTRLASEFFHTLDMAPRGFVELTEGTIKIDFVARTAVNLLGQYSKQLEKLAQDGCAIRILVIDASSGVAGFVYGTPTADPFLQNAQKAEKGLLQLQAKLGDKLKVRITRFAPTMGLMCVHKKKEKGSFVQVQLYFLHSCIGNDRPLFLVNVKDAWYKPLLDEFEQLWHNGIEWPRNPQKP